MSEEVATEIANRAEAAWRDFTQRLDNLPRRELEHPRGESEWSPREVIAHVGRWEEWAVARIDRHLTGDDTPLDDVDAVNARWLRSDARVTLDAARDRAAEAHRRLMARVRELEPAMCDRAVEMIVAANTWDHYAEHIASLGI